MSEFGVIFGAYEPNSRLFLVVFNLFSFCQDQKQIWQGYVPGRNDKKSWKKFFAEYENYFLALNFGHAVQMWSKFSWAIAQATVKSTGLLTNKT